MLKKVYERLGTESFFGGLFGIVAIIAIVIEVSIAGFSSESILAGIKEIAGIIVAVMVFIFAARRIFGKKIKETFENILTAELEAWSQRTSPIILEATDFPRPNESKDMWCRKRFYLLTNLEKILRRDHDENLVEKYSRNAGVGNGVFVDLPVDFHSHDMVFRLNNTTLMKRATANGTSTEVEMKILAGDIQASISEKFGDLCDASHSDKTINVRIRQEVELSPATAREIVKLIDYVFLLYAITC